MDVDCHPILGEFVTEATDEQLAAVVVALWQNVVVRAWHLRLFLFSDIKQVLTQQWYTAAGCTLGFT